MAARTRAFPHTYKLHFPFCFPKQRPAGCYIKGPNGADRLNAVAYRYPFGSSRERSSTVLVCSFSFSTKRPSVSIAIFTRRNSRRTSKVKHRRLAESLTFQGSIGQSWLNDSRDPKILIPIELNFNWNIQRFLFEFTKLKFEEKNIWDFIQIRKEYLRRIFENIWIHPNWKMLQFIQVQEEYSRVFEFI